MRRPASTARRISTTGLAAAALIVALVSPFLGAIADHMDKRKGFLLLFTALGGVIFAVLRLVTHSLFPPSALHWAMNGTGVVVGWFVHRSRPTTEASPADDEQG